VNGSFELLVGSERGYLYRYGNIDGNLTGNFTLIDSIGWNIWEGGRIAPFTADLNSDDLPELILGNIDGGLTYYRGDSLLSGIYTDVFSANNLNVFPNPASEMLTVRYMSKNFTERKISIYDCAGKLVYTARTVQPVIEINCSEFESGFYFLVSVEGEKSTVKKIIISK
jgi:hypothetical protein